MPTNRNNWRENIIMTMANDHQIVHAWLNNLFDTVTNKDMVEYVFGNQPKLNHNPQGQPVVTDNSQATQALIDANQASVDKYKFLFNHQAQRNWPQIDVAMNQLHISLLYVQRDPAKLATMVKTLNAHQISPINAIKDPLIQSYVKNGLAIERAILGLISDLQDD